jgi:hypothetical protein
MVIAVKPRLGQMMNFGGATYRSNEEGYEHEPEPELSFIKVHAAFACT